MVEPARGASPEGDGGTQASHPQPGSTRGRCDEFTDKRSYSSDLKVNLEPEPVLLIDFIQCWPSGSVGCLLKKTKTVCHF